MKFSIAAILSTLLAGSLLHAQQPSAAKDAPRLVYVIYVSRHGVRSPTGKSEQYDRYSSSAWPTWSVTPGYLTPHGYQLMKLFGAYDLRRLQTEHLLTGDSCASAASVTFQADSDERTRETAKALAEGLFPGCAVAVNALAEGTNDPIFHLPAGEISTSQAEFAAAAIRGRIGNDPAAVAPAYRASLASLDSLLADCGPRVASHTRSSILDIPATVASGSGDHVAEMRGPLNTASTLTENLLLEYTEGMPAKDVGWGCIDGTKLRTLIDLHTAASDIALRTHAVAIPQSAHLLRAIDQSIAQAVATKPIAGAMGKSTDKALFLIGHDTNLSNIAGALDLDWLLDGRRNDTPPGSALTFELWSSGAEKKYSVRLYFTAQTLEQMRDATVLVGDQAPPRVPVFIPGCSRTDFSCDVASFHQLVERLLVSSNPSH